MDAFLLAVVGINDLWFSLPLIVTVSFVYAATRHERIEQILLHSGRIAIWIVGFMAIVFVVLSSISWFV